MINKEEKREYRKVSNYEVRQLQDSNMTEITGYIAKFNSVTELFEGFFEKIDPHAFDNTLADGHNIFLLYHHDWSKPLASTKIGTLQLNSDDVGLKFTATINNNISYVKDVIELINEGLVCGCSFGFCCINDSSEYNSQDDTITRTLLEVELSEGSLLCIPAYEDTEVFARAKMIEKEERDKLQKQKSLEIRKKKIEIELELMN
ncbi:HK97 family phage prohead protease [Clostridium felsineum]|uniref:HK97 family phage prohead protease n=1 Tax=Clostridium felsineum TaxID=36839 RepID=UPI00098BD159|nr:HK97 family phage prohead protease [Clostridium felsineum]URZ15327.1 hypothetical protein CLFE_013450 [Clostridium felsineum DSM 794]